MADSKDTTSSKSPAFQFYPNDFLSDRNVIVMSLQERGAYITLICLAWEAPIPDDVEHIARMCGVPLTAMRKLWPALSVCFRPDPDAGGFLIHPRLEKEREKQAQYRRRQSDASKKRWESHGNATASKRDIPAEMPPDIPRVSSSSSSSSSDFSQHSRKERESVSRTRMGSGVMGGTLPRDHLRHSWCGRVCVPDFLHGQFVQATGQTDEALKSFYSQTFAAIPEDEAVEPDSVKFWRPLVVQRWPPKKQSGDAITPETLAAGLRAARERGDFDARH